MTRSYSASPAGTSMNIIPRWSGRTSSYERESRRRLRRRLDEFLSAMEVLPQPEGPPELTSYGSGGAILAH